MLFQKTASVSGKIEVDWENCHRYKNGRVISAQRKRGGFFNYFFGKKGGLEDKRVKFCEDNRNVEGIPESFRRGDYDFDAMMYLVYVMAKGWKP